MFPLMSQVRQVPNLLLNQFKNLSLERQAVIWQQILQTPAFTEFLVEAKKVFQLQYYDMPEPETFQMADMAQNFSERKQLKSVVRIIDNILDIDQYMRNKTESI